MAETAKITVTTQQKSLTKYLSSKKVILTALELKAKQDKKTDADFKTATTNGLFDDVFSSALKSGLTTYARDLKKNYDNASTPAVKKILGDSYKSTVLLLK